MKWLTVLATFVSCSSGFAFPPDQTILAVNEVSTFSKDDLYKVIDNSPVCSLHRQLCEIPSVTGNEEAVGDFVVHFLENHNFTVTKQPVPLADDSRTRFNIYAVPDPDKFPSGTITKPHHPDGPKVILSSHIDTVPPHLNYTLTHPKHPSPQSSRSSILISGRGTVDDKACVAAQITTALSLLSAAAIPPTDIALLFVIGEETTGDGMKHFSSSSLSPTHSSPETLRAVLFGEPTELKLATGHKGITMLHLTAHGKAAHSGYPWLGRSANSMILPALLALDKLGDIPESEGGLPRSKRFGKSTVNVGFMQGGVAGNVVPEHASAEITFRLAGGTIEEANRRILDAVKKADPKGELEVVLGQGYGPVVCDADVDGFETISVNYGTDVPNLKLPNGVKRYLYGPGSILVAHGANEGLTVGDLEESVEGYKRMVKHVLGS